MANADGNMKVPVSMRRRGMPSGAKPQNTRRTILRLFQAMGRQRVLLIPVFFAVLVSASATIAGTYILRPVLNEYIIPFIGQQNPDLSGLARLLMKMAVLFVIGAFATYLNSRIMLTLSTGTLFRIRTALFRRLEKLPLQYFDTHTHGELMSLFTNDTDTLRDMFSQSIPQLFTSAVTITGAFIMMVILSPPLTLIVIVVIAVMVAFIKLIGSRSANAFRSQQQNLGRVNGYIEEMIEGQKVVKVFCHENAVKDVFSGLNTELCASAALANSLANMMGPLMSNLSYIGYALCAVAGVLLIIGGYLDIGTAAAFLQYSRSSAQPVTQMSQQFNSILNALAGAERIFHAIDELAETDEGTVSLVNAVKIQPNTGDKQEKLVEAFAYTGCWAWKRPLMDGSSELIPMRGEICFDNVSFGYRPEKTVLHNISLRARPGQKIALVGSTGSGKTTITNLLTRFYDISEGTITYDGIPIKEIKKDSLRRSLGMVLQDTHLFSGSVSDNIRYGRPEASRHETEAAARLANADSFIAHLPNGYDTELTADGVNLSQGQRQLLSIARAAAANPPVLILDEATSSIDTRTESLIEKGMNRLMDGRTVFIIAHRLSTIRNADVILVLEQGRIIEQGSHAELLARQGRYYQLYTGMFELS